MQEKGRLQLASGPFRMFVEPRLSIAAGKITASTYGKDKDFKAKIMAFLKGAWRILVAVKDGLALLFLLLLFFGCSMRF
jgi:N-acetylneuraminic acid mutarotase